MSSSSDSAWKELPSSDAQSSVAPSSASALSGNGGQQPLLRALDAATLQSIHASYPLLTALDLSGNALTSDAVSPDLASYLPHLRSISLAHNRLTSMPRMDGLLALSSVDLSGNRISHVEHLSALPSLTSLNLAHNDFSDLESLCAELIMECPSLSSLSLEHNPLSAAQYRVALLSLLPLTSLDGQRVREEEKAYLQLLAANMPNTGREGEQQPSLAEQMRRSPQALLQSAAHASPGDDLRVEDVDSAASESPLVMSPSHSAPDSDRSAREEIWNQLRREEEVQHQRVIPPVELEPQQDRSQQQPQQGFLQGDAMGRMFAELRNAMQQQGQEDEEEEQAQAQDAESDDDDADEESPWNAQAAGAAASIRESPAGSNYSSQFASVAPSPALRPATPPAAVEAALPSPPVQPAQPNLHHQQFYSSAPQSYPSAVHPPMQPHPSHPSQWAGFSYAPVAHPPLHPYMPFHPPPATYFTPHPHPHPQPQIIAIHAPAPAPAPVLAPVAAAVAAPIAAPAVVAPVAAPVLPPPSAAPPAVAVDTTAAVASALTAQADLVRSLQRQLQEAKETAAREQARARTVQAYYQPSDSALPAQPAASPSSSLSASSRPVRSSDSLALPILSLPKPDPAVAASAASAAMLESYRVEIAHLKQQNELLQIQTDTGAEILRMKDQQSEDLRVRHLQARGKPIDDPDQSVLWRDKVFALLVQNKSLILAHTADCQHYKKELLAKEQALTQANQQLLLVNKSNASLQAQLQLLHNDSAHRTQVQEHTHQLQAQVHASKQQVARDVANIEHLLGVFQEQILGVEEKTRARVESKLNEFNRRLTYASSRVHVAQAMKARKNAPVNGSPAIVLSLSESKERDVDDEDLDSNGRHMPKEIERLQADRSLIYSSWQQEVSGLRAQLYAQSSRLTSAESAQKSLQNELSTLQAEAAYLSKQNSDLRQECSGKFSKDQMSDQEREYRSRIEELQAELSSVSDQLIALKLSSDAAHKSHLKLQVELQQTKHLLAQSKHDAAELLTTKLDYLEEKLKRREAQNEELITEKRKMQQQMRDMDHQLILLRHGVGQQQGNGAAVAAPAHLSASARPSSSSFSQVLFGGAGAAGGPVPAFPTSSYAAPAASSLGSNGYPSRPQPLQPSWPAPAAPPPAATSVFGHDNPIPAVFAQPALTYAPTSSAAYSRAQSRAPSVAASPSRPRAEPQQQHQPSQQFQPHIPALQFPSSSQASAVTSPVRAAHSAAAPQQSTQQRKLSHLAALSARLLDDDDDD